MGRLILAGTVPIVLVGGLFADRIETTFRSPAVVAAALIIGGLGLLVAERLGTRQRDERSIGYWEAFAIGVAQASALVPGISRSGATMTVAMLFGCRRDAAARFVFLMSLPAVLAAAAKEGLEVAEAGVGAIPWALFAVGLAVSAVVGYLTVKYFIRFLAGHTLTGFAIYRFALAAVAALWLLA
jgi:undecaprenyl-diphosphatase